MDFVSWSTLATYAESLTMVTIITQLTKELGFIKKIPTQIWSYIISLIVLYMAYFFIGDLDLSNAFLIPFNSMIVTLASNGGFVTLTKLFPKIFGPK